MYYITNEFILQVSFRNFWKYELYFYLQSGKIFMEE